MRIRMPAVRALYPASRNEPDRLLLWIPRHELEQLAAGGRVKPETLEYYPSGLEVRVSRQGFAEFGLDLGIDPDTLHSDYRALRDAGGLPKSGIVAADRLEQAAEGDAASRNLFALPEPEWTDGKDARIVMGNL